MPSPHPVELHEVSKLYGSFAALRKVTTHFRSGECAVILGPNGAGKSTLLRVIAGLLQPSYGTVSILGACDLAQVRERVGYLGHDSMLYDELTALENLRYTAKLYGGAGRALQTPEAALTMVGLDPALDRAVGKFSQGMRQRAALARVLIARPELLLLDEPFSNVDIASSAKMLQVLRDLRSAGTTILMTTHQPELARPIADLFCTMQSGSVASVQHVSNAYGSGAE